MSFSAQWDQVYREESNISIFPWSDLVSYIYRYAKPFKSETKVLEIGFGAGANIPLFKALGVDYSGIEGSQAIHSKICETYQGLKDKLYLGDFLSYEFPESYDVIADRSAMTHNSTLAIRNGLKHLSNHLVVGGKYIGIDWFSTCHSDYLLGDVVDEFTRINITEGQFFGVGNIHFSNKEHILSLFSESGFIVTHLEQKVVTREIPNVGHKFSSWNLVAVKI